MPRYGCGHNFGFFVVWILGTVVLWRIVVYAQVVPHIATVHIKNGTIRGDVLTINGFSCNVFLGIPYARPPLNNLRFMRPRTHHGWPGVLIANKYRSACMQPTGAHHFLNAGAPVSEDCLYLNIFAPEQKSVNGQPYPVFLWVHGGGFVYGTAATLHPNDICNRIVSRGVVVVTTNYRLGPFGFLDMPSQDLPSNVGVYDILHAMMWVNENIETFGGDKSRVTLGGHGSGAACVSKLTLNSYATSLMSRVILMSGSILAPWAVTSHSASSTKKLSQSLACHLSNSTLDCLRKASAGTITSVAPPLWSLSPRHTENDEFWRGEPSQLLESGNHKNLPIVIGLSRDEAAFLVFQKLSNISAQALTHNSFFGRLIPEFVGDFLRAKNHPLADVLKFQYFSWHPSGNLYDYLDTSIQLYTDFLYRSPILKEAVLRAQLPKSKVFVYSFAQEADIFLGKNTVWKGSPHGLDIIHLWGPNSVQPRKGFFQISPTSLHSAISHLWTGFIKNRTNSPNAMGLIRWVPFSESNPFVLEIGSQLSMVPANLEKRMRFWTEFLPQLLDAISKNMTAPILNADGSSTEIITTTETSRETFSTLGTAKSTKARTTTITASTTARFSPSTIEPETQGKAPPSQTKTGKVNRTVLWLMVSLALIFFLLCLFTAGACAAWNRQSYHPRGPNPRSRHQNAQVRRPQGPPILSPPIPPRPPPQSNNHSSNGNHYRH